MGSNCCCVERREFKAARLFGDVQGHHTKGQVKLVVSEDQLNRMSKEELAVIKEEEVSKISDCDDSFDTDEEFKYDPEMHQIKRKKYPAYEQQV
jgi:hypothetical protein